MLIGDDSGTPNEALSLKSLCATGGTAVCNKGKRWEQKPKHAGWVLRTLIEKPVCGRFCSRPKLQRTGINGKRHVGLFAN